ncbi:MAG TPA: hypothetical protein VJN43_04445 [Bryobacteraceae bacterium]|nr:hypothetical protein [Bryobacteraceae bacterium]
MPYSASLTDTLQRATGTVGSNTVTELINTVLPQTVGSLSDTLTTLSQRFDNLVATSQLQSDALAANTHAIIQETSTQQNQSITTELGRAASGLLQGGLGFSPVISGLMDLFGAGTPAAPQPLVPFSLPPSLTFQAANTDAYGPPSGADYTQAGIPRVMEGRLLTGAAPSVASPQITINVQAMDSQSFSDHSSDIAKAVREAILNMHALNDVVTDL